MSREQLLLINPRITAKARFPLSLLSLAGALQDQYDCHLLDGNLERDTVGAAQGLLRRKPFAAVGVTVMGGPQVRTAIDVSWAIRKAAPRTPIVWGGYFPTLYPEVALNAPYVDYVIRGQGETTFRELLHSGGDVRQLERIGGLTWTREGAAVNNPDREFAPPGLSSALPYELLGDPRRYLARTFMGRRTAAHQAAQGCRFRCTFCGVAAMFHGATALPPARRLDQELHFLKHTLGADSIQFYDHNFFDREADMIPILEVLARHALPWWCYARADALLGLSASSWALVRKSGLRMAYIGAESPSDTLLKSIRKGTRSDQTLAVVDLCRRQGVVPELSFMVAPPEDPEGETERTFEFVREVKRVNPRSEIIIYIYTPVPPSSLPERARVRAASKPLRDLTGQEIVFPRTPEGWTQRKWVDYACHADAPWMTPRLRQRIRDFVTVLGCRFPTVQDARTPAWTKAALRALAAWRYRFRRYDRPWELEVSRKLIRVADPRVTGI